MGNRERRFDGDQGRAGEDSADKIRIRIQVKGKKKYED